MITEDYVSFETAKLLKKKGFNIPCHSNYRSAYPNNISPFYHNGPKDFNGREYTNLNSEWYSAPTLQMAMKWLREVYSIHCDIGYDDLDWFWNILDVSDSVPVEERPKMIKDGLAACKSYEEACEAAIKYVLENLI